jgi:hypothetical protein
VTFSALITPALARRSCHQVALRDEAATGEALYERTEPTDELPTRQGVLCQAVEMTWLPEVARPSVRTNS